jgi:hypothetical protein
MATVPNGPMGSGIDIDIITREPVQPKTSDERANEAKAKMEEAIFQALSLQQDLAKSPLLALMLNHFTNRLAVLAKEDAVCQTILAVLSNIRSTIDIVPEYAHRRFKEILGASIHVAPLAPPDPAAQAIPGVEPPA